jgi:excisionase family DNA binding protein
MTTTTERPVRLLLGRKAADYLGLPRERVRRAIANDQLPYLVIGSRRMIPVAALNRILAEGKFTQTGE